ncbi:MAG: hypothetical protein WC121_11705 [Candidatus Kapaibacterium sp.]
MAADQLTFGEALVALAAKLIPGVFGSIVALRGLPPDSTWLQRVTAVGGGAAAAWYLAPAISEWAGIGSKNIEGALAFLVGAFAMVVIGEVHATIRDVQIAAIARDAIRKFLRLDRGA